jgi:hypothetical protein
MLKPAEMSAHRQPLRLWPGVILGVVLVVAAYVVPNVAPDAELFSFPLAVVGILGGVGLGLAIVLWWLFFSRAAWVERIGAVVLMITFVLVTRLLVDASIRGAHMGMSIYLFGIPGMALALVVWAVATRHFSDGARRAWLPVAIAMACAPWLAIRTAGVIGAGSEYHWRWTPTPEERLLAQAADEPKPESPPPPAAPAQVPAPPAEAAAGDKPRDDASLRSSGGTASSGDRGAAAKSEPTPPALANTPPETRPKDPATTRAVWPGFRGPERDAVIRGVRIETDWSRSAPVERWRRAIGPGWSSFAVVGNLIYTQEQRGEDEIVSCYDLNTGAPVWMHRDRARFWESNAGPGPRGTPTLSGDRVYALGATGILNALDARTGRVIWSLNAATDTGVTVPDWGIASSPVVTHGVVIVALSGQLVAYDIDTGKQRWLGPTGGAGYSSPHLLTIDGVPQIVLLRGSRTISVAPADGTLLWEDRWEVGVSIVQPALTTDGDVLITVGDAMGALGIRRIAVQKESTGWKVEEKWTSRGLKPYFNDFVVHKGHAYGFDGAILASIDLQDGTRKWKGGRYGNGQLVLLPEQDLLLLISEDGELALVSATPDKYTEVARFTALHAKTWNHPVVVGDTLLVRNGEEMAAFRLPGARLITDER